MGLAKILRKGIFMMPLIASLACGEKSPTQIKPFPFPSPVSSDSSGLLKLCTFNGTDSTCNLLHSGVAKIDDATYILSACTHDLRLAPGKSDIIENMAIFVSEDGYRWRPMENLRNPVMNADDVDSTRIFSDPEVFNIRQGLLGLLERMPTDTADVIYERTTDLRTLSDYKVVLTASNNGLLSPTVLEIGDKFNLWAVDAGFSGCNSSESFLTRRVSSKYDDFKEARVDTADAHIQGYALWHPDMIEGPSDTLILLIAAHPIGQECGNSDLFLGLGKSEDGLHFKIFGMPLKARGENRWLEAGVYRSTGEYDRASRKIRFIYSGFNRNFFETKLVETEEYDFDKLISDLSAGNRPLPVPPAYLENFYLNGREGRVAP